MFVNIKAELFVISLRIHTTSINLKWFTVFISEVAPAPVSSDPNEAGAQTHEAPAAQQPPPPVPAPAVEPQSYKDIVVEIERCTYSKPYLGGYRHKTRGVEFHHASAQTMRRPKPDTGKVMFSRDSQTTQEKHLYQQVS